MALLPIFWKGKPRFFSSNHCHVLPLYTCFFSSGFDSIVFYSVGMLTLHPTPNLKDQGLRLEFIPLGKCLVWLPH